MGGPPEQWIADFWRGRNRTGGRELGHCDPAAVALPAIASFTSKSTSASAYAVLKACESGSPRSASSIAMCSAAFSRAFCRTKSHGSSPGKSCNRTPAWRIGCAVLLQRLLGRLSAEAVSALAPRLTKASVPAIRHIVATALPTRTNISALALASVEMGVLAPTARAVLNLLP